MQQSVQERQCWSASETRSPEAQEDRDVAALQAQLTYLLDHSAFYQAKFAGLSATDVSSTADLARFPFTEKEELRASLAQQRPLGLHQAAELSDIIQIQATSGTTGVPSFFGLTEADLGLWAESGARVFYSCGLRPGEISLHAMAMSRGFAGGAPGVRVLQRLGLCVVPLGAEAGADRLLVALERLGATSVVTGPNFAIHLGEQAQSVLGKPAHELGIRQVVVGGEPGGGVPEIRDRIEKLWGAKVTECLGNSDVVPTLWGECHQQNGMHWMGQDIVVPELIDPITGENLAWETGVTGELVYTALERRASPVFRFRSRDHVVVLGTEPCACGRISPRIRCVGRTDDMLIVRGVNVWPAAVRDIVAGFHPETTGLMRILADFPGHVTDRHLRVRVEHADHLTAAQISDLDARINRRMLSSLAVRIDLELVPAGTIEQPTAGKVALVQRTIG